jgi:hypothetical protein
MPLEQPAIQFWAVEAAPEHLRTLLPPESSYGWVAVVPAALQDREVLSLLTGGDELGDQLFQTKLPSGECLLAGPFQSKPSYVAATQSHSNARKAMSAGHTAGLTRADRTR